MKKVGIVMLILVILVFGVGFLLRTCSSANDAPGVSEAPYKIQTDSRYYLAKDYSIDTDKFGKYILLKGYWYTDNGKAWKYDKQLKLSYRGFIKEPVVTKRNITAH